ncbi:sulfatase-like hydrolase/transferase, partial [Rubripirellula sp.]
FITDAAKSDRPFCLSISFKAPHKPATPDPQFDSIYAGKKFTRPSNYGREYGEHFSLQSRAGRQFERFHSWNYSDKYDEVMATYYQQIYAIDIAVGMIREAIDKAGVKKNTVVIYTSDNGFFCGSHGYGSKVLPYEESSRVPLIIFDPRHSNSGKQLRCDSLTGNVDFAPTILNLAGIKIPRNMDGQDLMPLYDDPKAKIHDSLPLINVWGPKKAHSYAVVTESWKYIYWPYRDDQISPTEELYDTQSDPSELTELSKIESAAGDLIRMRQIYDEAVKSWQAEAVPYHKYSQFGEHFQRH